MPPLVPLIAEYDYRDGEQFDEYGSLKVNTDLVVSQGSIVREVIQKKERT